MTFLAWAALLAGTYPFLWVWLSRPRHRPMQWRRRPRL